jgi:predicted O-methyltransferase YrrM
MSRLMSLFSKKEPVDPDLPVPDVDTSLPPELAGVYQAKPSWIIREITKEEAKALARELRSASARTAIEIGVASGFSSAVILSCLRRNSASAKLYAFDLAERCYFDSSKRTGQAVREILGNEENYHLTTGVTSADIDSAPETVDFVFIDAGHRHPWPTLDLLSLHRFIKPGGLIGLHDVNWPLQAKVAYRQNGPRDLIRAWTGTKRIYKAAANIGFVDVGSDDTVFESVCRALQTDWDTEIDDKTLEKYLPVADRFGAGARDRLSRIFEEKKATVEKTKLVRV